MWEFIDKVVFINLEKRKDRLDDIIEVCKVFPPEKVVRFNAIENKECGLIGCGKSHAQVIQMAIDNKWKNVLVLEDDTTWNKYDTGYTNLEELVKKDYDVIIIGGCLDENGIFDTNTNRVVNVQTTTAYIVHEKFYNTLLDNFNTGVTLLEQTGIHWLYAIDQYWKQLQREHIFLMIVPNMMYQSDGFSDNSRTYVYYKDSFKL